MRLSTIHITHQKSANDLSFMIDIYFCAQGTDTLHSLFLPFYRPPA